MVDVIGTSLAVIGLLGQLFDGCVKAYGYFTAAALLDADSQRLLCKVRIEEMRLVVWGREWGVAEGRFDQHLDSEQARNPQLRALATQILQQLHGAVTDFRRLQDRYGLVEGARNGGGGDGDATATTTTGGAASLPRGVKDEDSRKTSGSRNGKARSWGKEIGLRTKWVIGDKDKFTNLLKDLKDFNDGLEALFPPSQVPSFQRAWTNQLLEHAQRDVAELSLLEKASSGIYPQLTASANLKKLRINLDSTPQASFKPTFALRVPRAALEIRDGADDDDDDDNDNDNSSGSGSGSGKQQKQKEKEKEKQKHKQKQKQKQKQQSSRRCRARHESAGDVLIEWVDYDRDAVDERVAHVRRLDDLARMTHSASRCHPDLHGVDCLGYTDDAANSRYGLVYRAPAPSFCTLHDALVAGPDLRTPDLDRRVRLAHTLAVALWSLHSLDWLHKSLCSANVLFFPSALSPSPSSSSSSAAAPPAAAIVVPDIDRPYLSGFDASRPDLDAALSVAPRNPSVEDLHRHPSSLRPGRSYRKAFDVYGLGLVLLEIGLWRALQAYYKPHYSAERWRDRVVLAALVPGLGSKVGRRYREVVEMCLRADEDMTSAEAGELMETVVSALESIRV